MYAHKTIILHMEETLFTYKLSVRNKDMSGLLDFFGGGSSSDEDVTPRATPSKGKAKEPISVPKPVPAFVPTSAPTSVPTSVPKPKDLPNQTENSVPCDNDTMNKVVQELATLNATMKSIEVTLRSLCDFEPGKFEKNEGAGSRRPTLDYDAAYLDGMKSMDFELEDENMSEEEEEEI
jgi:hypothetical protein